jgi:plasmid maintenance system antidote protein VapI
MTFVKKVVSTEMGKRGFNRERAMLELTELICEVMEREGVTRAELARRMGRSKGFVTRLLDGRANIMIRLVADVFTALEQEIQFRRLLHRARC